MKHIQLPDIRKKHQNDKEELIPRPEIPAREIDPAVGLSADEVQARLENGYGNISNSSPTKTVGQIVKSNTLTFFNLVFVILAVCLIAVGSYSNLLFLIIAAANTFIGIFQEIRSKKAIDRLTLLAEQKVPCIRDGSREEIPSSELVRDDIVEFENGSQICADAVVLSGQVTVNESLLTGETDAIPKLTGDALKSGSFISGGHCTARLTHVGADSYASRLAEEAKSDVKLAKSEMMRSLDRLIRVIGILLVPVGICLFLTQHQMGLTVKGAVEATVAALIGMIPEGLYLLTSIAIAVGVLRLSRRKVLVRDMNCVEILARVDTLCVDKTGTITEPGMDVDKLVLLDEENFPEEAVMEMLAAFYDNMEADNDTGAALAACFKNDSDWEAREFYPFTSETKWSGITFAEHGSFLIGAPEFIMGSRIKELKKKIRPWAEQGMRVLLAASYEGGTGYRRPYGRADPPHGPDSHYEPAAERGCGNLPVFQGAGCFHPCHFRRQSRNSVPGCHTGRHRRRRSVRGCLHLKIGQQPGSRCRKIQGLRPCHSGTEVPADPGHAEKRPYRCHDRRRRE